MKLLVQIFWFSYALLLTTLSHADDATSEPAAKNIVLYQCRIPSIPGVFDQPDLVFELQQKPATDSTSEEEVVSVQLSSVWNKENISDEKITTHKDRFVNRFGKVYPLNGNMVEEKIRTKYFSYNILIPATDDGTYFKDEQAENEAVSWDEETRPSDVLAPGTVVFKVPSEEEPGGFYLDSWSIVCQVPKTYRDKLVEKLNQEAANGITPMDLYNFFKALINSALKLAAPQPSTP